MSRQDDRGRAYRGSQLQMQIYVNRREPEFSDAVLGAFADLAGSGVSLRWTSPLEEKNFAEYRDATFLQAIERPDLADSLREFWPAGGPVWDGLAVFSGPRGSGVVLAEGKSYPQELYSGGTQATSESSLELIRSSLAVTQQWLGAEPDPERWMRPLRPNDTRPSSLYQSANRYAALYWLREICGVDAKLVHVLFHDDSTSDYPTTRTEWEAFLPRVEEELGLAGKHVPHAEHVFLAGRTRDELVPQP